jgi:hypothetical protein
LIVAILAMALTSVPFSLHLGFVRKAFFKKKINFAQLFYDF